MTILPSFPPRRTAMKTGCRTPSLRSSHVAIDRLEGFLRATGWNCIYGLNLGVGST